MELIVASLGPTEAYRLLIGAVVPRPIAWITSMSNEGLVNLAPFSFFTLLSADPPLLGISISRRGGERKDTSRNISDRREFVVHIADETQAELVHLSSIDHPPDVSEVQLLGLQTRPSTTVSVPRLACAPIALECRYRQTFDLGEGSDLIVGEVIALQIRDALFQEGKIDPRALRPLARFGGPNFAGMGDLIQVSRQPGLTHTGAT
jgi:flavin reductase (DIM6/NTAB) family NADH-FMN oxidoreductase RutF